MLKFQIIGSLQQLQKYQLQLLELVKKKINPQ